MDLFCNPSMVEKVTKAKRKMIFKINGGMMLIKNKATVNGYNQKF